MGLDQWKDTLVNWTSFDINCHLSLPPCSLVQIETHPVGEPPDLMRVLHRLSTQRLYTQWQLKLTHTNFAILNSYEAVIYLTLTWVGSNFTPSCWFSLINWETIKAGILQHFAAFSHIYISDILTWFCVSISPQSPDVGQNSEGGISDFWISGESLRKESCHNSRTSDDIDMKLGALTKLDKRHKIISKIFVDDVILANHYAIVIFPIYGQFKAIKVLDSGRKVCKTYIFINLLSYKNSNQN